MSHDLPLLPLLLVKVFTGTRPAEACRLEWTDLDLLKAHLIVRAAISKTGTARSIKLAPCALAWFGRCTRSASALVPFSEPVLRRRLRKLRYLAGFRDAGAYWAPGSLRDAFCSYHLAHFGSIDRLIQEAGHASLRTTKDHYLGLVSAEAAVEFDLDSLQRIADCTLEARKLEAERCESLIEKYVADFQAWLDRSGKSTGSPMAVQCP